jgi:Protein of unknown function (DUF3723)
MYAEPLNSSTLTGINQLLRHEALSNAFDTLLVFPGLWSGLELGNIQKMLVLRCNEVNTPTSLIN